MPVDMGGCFIGPNHERLHALAKETGVSTFKTFVDGDNVLATGGKVRRYRGDIPKISPLALVSAGQAIARMSSMAKKVSPPPRGTCRGPPNGTRRPCGRGCRRGGCRPRLPATSSRRRCGPASPSELSELSLLGWLLLVSSAGGVEALMNIKGGYQDSQFEGGVDQIPRAMAHRPR